jgi:hypothetical protein
VTSGQQSQSPQEPLAEIGREPLHEAIADARSERRGGISLQTLGVASAASAAASFAASHLWGPGTVASAALTPVVVALVSEFLRRPVNRVSVTAQRVVPIAQRPADPRHGPPAPQQPPPPTAEWSAISYGDAPRPAPWRPRWRLVLLTGLLAFAIVVGFYTVPDLLVGHSITGGGGATTFFSSGGSAPSTPTPTQTTTQTQTVTTTVPSTTLAAPPPTTTTPTTPGPTDTAPQQTAPPAATTPSPPAATLTPTTPGATTTPTTTTPPATP